MQTTLLIDHQAHTSEDGTVVRALLTIRGEAPVDAARPQLGLSLVLDRSGSMSGEPLEAVREAAARAVERLHPADVVGAVAFDDEVEEVGAIASVATHSHLAATLRALETRGSTNLSGGWLRGRQQMADALGLMTGNGSTRRVVLLTDGLANVGITDVDRLVGLAREARSKGITTSTVGVGDGYDDQLLRAMADAGGGNAWYIERPDQAQDVFAEELGNLLSVAAQSVRVSLTLHDPVGMLLVHSDWPVTPGSETWRFDLGDLYASEPKPLLFELFVPRRSAAATDVAETVMLATLTIQADVLTADGGVEHRVLTMPIAATSAMQDVVVPELEKAVLLARTAKYREDAARAQRDGDADRAREIMAQASSAIIASPLTVDDEMLCQQVADLTALGQQYERGELHEMDAKYQMQRAYNMKRGKHRYDGQIRRDNG
ncbi:VWA domain-containing protein [Gemmatimonas sp.]|uniref:vWA domain-containing protein n=1 Tax=Gemmatimonas sp. TaxID=1962908 RepID=UPI003564C554